MKPRFDRDWVIAHWLETPKTKFTFFWSSKPRKDGILTEAVFSQWYPLGFTVNDQHYPTAEHWMMAEKARLFSDQVALAEILSSADPGRAKAMGRTVRGFDQAGWDKAAFEIVLRGNRAKFTQSEEAKQVLLRTGSKIIAEASPLDAIWGIGLAADAEEALYPDLWPGTNLLGAALMQLRAELLDPP